ncbi:MAG: hypothetical protein M5R42_04060 [Rhodocyclaceae bacterium]|nr:hypothetical protein [Rhodocyclaceae bacterium]
MPSRPSAAAWPTGPMLCRAKRRQYASRSSACGSNATSDNPL